MTPIKAETAHLLTLPEIAACQIIYPPANVGSISEPTKSIRIFGVQEVASWRLLQKTAEEQCKTVKPLVDIPPVQRGLVWDVNQVEIFWDSLMRGFPFGALVFVPKKDGPERFDLFDGQQRCDAIYWGFQPNFDQELTKKDSLSQILWLDLLPGDRLKHSTRRFLARLTTKAHPWGFWRNDNASPLPLSDRRKFLEKMKEVMQKPGHTEVSAAFEAGWRPALSDCVPHDAGFPVPMPVIFQHFDNRTQQIDWKKVAEHPLVGLAEYWKNTTLAQVVADPKHKTDLEKIVKSLGIVANTPVVAICVAPDANDVAGGFEELFVRLNRNGTPLSEEELAYSMIKVGWPEIRETMDAVDQAQKRHASEARLARMGMRAALTGSEATKLEPAPAPTVIRTTLTPGASYDDESTEKLQNRRKCLEKFFALERSSEGKQTAKILDALEWIDNQLCYDAQSRSYGIPAYLRSAIAWRSPEVFSWLMVLANRHNFRDIDEQSAKTILGLALSLHWFAEDRERAVNQLMERSHNRDLTLLKLNEIDKDDHHVLLWPVLTHEQLVNAIQFERICQLEGNILRSWKSSIWQGVVSPRETDQDSDLIEQITKTWGKRPGKIDRTWEDVGYSVDRIHRQFEFLVYAQRRYIGDVFKNFDPSDQRLWKGHNRPWDYDHILAKSRLDATGRASVAGSYHGICKLWQETIGNFVAIDLVDNRSASNESPSEKRKLYDNLVTSRAWKPFLKLSDTKTTDPDELPTIKDFEIELNETGNAQLSAHFVQASQRRMIALYRHWFDELNIKDRIGASE